MPAAAAIPASFKCIKVVVGERMAGWFLWRTVRPASREDRREKHRERHRDILRHKHRQGEKPRERVRGGSS